LSFGYSCSLDLPISVQEIKDAIWDCGEDKSLIPDWESESSSSIPKGCYTSVLINGSPTSELKLKRDVRQGDPLSPFLFIMDVQVINVAVLDARAKNLFSGVEVGIDKIHISHLQYADDALIIGEWSFSNAKNLSRILFGFHLASGLIINFNKSIFYGVGVSHLELSSSSCNRFQKIPSNWQFKTLSIGGRLTLTKAVLGSVFLLQFKAPKSVTKKLESIRRNLFWSGYGDEKR
ncbi:putative RNA-directed DNA polymerase, eukaryota, reverse transcriptase zinc-binding domain protein, partial [Tanacetum coccineum]